MVESKKEAFFNSTLKLMYDKGFAGTSMRDIAKNANFKAANVYNYVDSKESILEQVIFDIFREFDQYMSHILESSCPADQKLRFLISKHIQFTISEPYRVALLVYDWRNLKEPKLREFQEMRKDYLLKVGSILKEGTETKQFRPMNVEMATFLVFSSLRWLFNIVIHDKKEHNPIEIEKQITDYIFSGIGVGDCD